MEFPASHTTTTTAPQDASASQKKIHINSSHLYTYEGKLKIAHIVVAIVVFISTMASNFPRSDHANWISFVSMGAFWTSIVLLFLHIINAVSLLTIIPWTMLELVYTALWAFFWFVSGCVAADYASRGAGDAFAVASFFSFVALFIYAFNAFLYYKKFRDGGSTFTFSRRSPAAGTSTTTTTTTTSTTIQKY